MNYVVAFSFLMLLTGYIYINLNYLYLFKLHHYDGQHLNLTASKIGFWITLESLCFVVITYLLFKNEFLDINHQLANEFKSTDLDIIFAFICLSMGVFLILNLVCSRVIHSFVLSKKFIQAFALFFSNSGYRLACRNYVLKNEPMEHLLVTSTMNNDSPYQYLLFTLRNNKVYIGIVYSITDKSKSLKAESSIEIGLFASGYRNKDTLRVNVDNVYNTNLDDIKKEENVHLMYIKYADIVSVSYFNDEIFNKFLLKEKSLNVGF